MEKIVKVKIYTDGASRGNPGKASYGYFILDEDDKVIKEEGKFIGITTNNVAEYTGVLEALRYITRNGEKKSQLELFADSKLVIEQLSGRFKVKAKHLIPIIDEIKFLLAKFEKVIYKHIPREKNYRADALANKALDKLASK